MPAWRRDVGMLVGSPAAEPALACVAPLERLSFRRVRVAAEWLVEQPGEARVRAAPSALPFRDASIAALAVSFLCDGADAGARAALLAELARVCVPGGALVAVDHNRPRRRAAAFVALLAPPRPAGRTLVARWRRLARPTAREVRAAGFVVERLRLAAGERVQIVFARRAGAAQNLAHQGTKRLPGTSTTTEY